MALVMLFLGFIAHATHLFDVTLVCLNAMSKISLWLVNKSNGGKRTNEEDLHNCQKPYGQGSGIQSIFELRMLDPNSLKQAGTTQVSTFSRAFCFALCCFRRFQAMLCRRRVK